MDFLHKKLNDNHGLKGTITVSNFQLPEASAEAKKLDHYLSTVQGLHPFKYQLLVDHLRTMCQVRGHVFYNQVHATGREVLARLLIADTTYSGEINFGALGSNSAAINDADTTLTTEVARKGYASRSRTNDSVTIDFYYSKSDTDGTYEEFATFIDGTASVDTGQMYNRSLTGGWTKSATEAMTVSLQIDINAA